MPFAEPRPNRKPFHAFAGNPPLTVGAKRKGGNLALTSFTVSSQGGKPRFVRVISRGGDGDNVLIEVLVEGGQTIHLPFPHPIMVGVSRKLVVKVMVNTGALLPVTVVGYEWNPTDERS